MRSQIEIVYPWQVGTNIVKLVSSHTRSAAQEPPTSRLSMSSIRTWRSSMLSSLSFQSLSTSSFLIWELGVISDCRASTSDAFPIVFKLIVLPSLPGKGIPPRFDREGAGDCGREGVGVLTDGGLLGDDRPPVLASSIGGTRDFTTGRGVSLAFGVGTGVAGGIVFGDGNAC